MCRQPSWHHSGWLAAVRSQRRLPSSSSSSFHINLDRARRRAGSGGGGDAASDTFHNPRLIVSRIRTTKAFRPSGRRAGGRAVAVCRIQCAYSVAATTMGCRERI